MPPTLKPAELPPLAAVVRRWAHTRTSPRAPDRALTLIYRRADRWMTLFIAGHFLFALALAPVHGTWREALLVGGASAAAFAVSAWRWPGTLWTRCLAGLTLQTFAALHIFQMQGLEEMHFFVFTGATLMIAYEDVVALWPGVVGLVAQHTVFTFWHNVGHPVGGMPFFEGHHVPNGKLAFHFGIAVLQVLIASCWAVALRRRTLAAARSVALLEATLDATADGVLVLDAAGRITDANRRFAELWGLAEAAVTRERSAPVLAHMASMAHDPAALGAEVPHEVGARLHAERLALSDGRVFERVVRPLLLDGAVVGRALSYRDVTAAERSQAALAASEARFRAVFEHAGVGIMFCDDDGVVQETNRATQEILGMTADELRGRASSALSPPEEAAVTRQPVRELKAGLHDHVTVEKRFTRGDGREILGALTVSLVRAGDTRGTVGMLQDITERRALEEQLVRQALTDPLTGLANRVLFRDRAGHAVVRAARAGQQVAALLVDLDGFKLVNDGLGHVTGDAVLIAVGERLQAAVRECDTVARLGGDEFAVLLESVEDPAEADAVAARVLESLRAPVRVTPAHAEHATEVFVGASVGVAVAEPGEGADTLIRNADVAMYAAKGRGKAQAARYETAMHDRALARLRLEADLRAAVTALEAGAPSGFRVVFQPIVSMRDQRLLGAEALLRWRPADGGAVTPAEFIPVAEDTGLIVGLGRWVLREACREAVGWSAHDAGGPAPYVAVNLSGRQLQEPALVDDVRAALAESGLAPERLTLEITESVVMRDTEFVLARLHALKALGVRLAVDDFGTGYSSLAYLRQFPVDVLKIDKRFVDDVARSAEAAALARTIVALAEMLDLRTVAEGVEDGAQRAALEAMGCGLGQGYLFARPLEAGALRARLAESVPLGA